MRSVSMYKLSNSKEERCKSGGPSTTPYYPAQKNTCIITKNVIITLCDQWHISITKFYPHNI